MQCWAGNRTAAGRGPLACDLRSSLQAIKTGTSKQSGIAGVGIQSGLAACSPDKPLNLIIPHHTCQCLAASLLPYTSAWKRKTHFPNQTKPFLHPSSHLPPWHASILPSEVWLYLTCCVLRILNDGESWMS